MNENTAVVAIQADGTQFTPAMQAMERLSTKTAESIESKFSQAANKGTDRLNASLDRMGRNLLAGAAAVVSLAGIERAFTSIATAGMGAQREAAKLDATWRATGRGADISTAAVGALASEFQRLTGADDDVVKGAYAMLAIYDNINTNTFPKIIEQASNLSILLGTNLSDATRQLAFAMNDPIEGMSRLKRSGIQFSDSQQEMIRGYIETNQLAKAQGVILKSLEERIGGVARTMGESAPGAVDKLRMSWGDLKEEIWAGVSANKAFMDTTNALTEAMEKQTKGMERARDLAYANRILGPAPLIEEPTGFGYGTGPGVGVTRARVGTPQQQYDEDTARIEKAKRLRDILNVDTPWEKAGGGGSKGMAEYLKTTMPVDRTQQSAGLSKAGKDQVDKLRKYEEDQKRRLAFTGLDTFAGMTAPHISAPAVDLGEWEKEKKKLDAWGKGEVWKEPTLPVFGERDRSGVTEYEKPKLGQFAAGNWDEIAGANRAAGLERQQEDGLRAVEISRQTEEMKIRNTMDGYGQLRALAEQEYAWERDTLVARYGERSSAVEALEQMHAETMIGIDKDMNAAMRVDSLRFSEYWADSLLGVVEQSGNSFDNIAEMFEQMIKKMVIKAAVMGGINLFTGGVGGFAAGALGALKLPGFAAGGYTGDGPRNEIAGVVHRGEWVIPAGRNVVREIMMKRDVAAVEKPAGNTTVVHDNSVLNVQLQPGEKLDPLTAKKFADMYRKMKRGE